MVLRLGTGDAYALLEALLRTEYGLSLIHISEPTRH